ncbi:MAG TPA: beta-propeller fold lactonase family protein [Gammaproteobacteria bacterium]|nr:beta-propeller fold lactonase family protein [Gammaproteobacteria bacterium]
MISASVFRAIVTSAAFVATLAATAHAADGPTPLDDGDRGGVVYAMTNASSGNQILAFARDRSGRLQPLPFATVATGGRGASDNAAIDPLGSQHSLVYDAASDSLFAVNAGDNTVSALDTGPFGLKLRVRARVPSGGFIPVSLAVSGERLYVLNAGGTGSVTTFAIDAHGVPTKVASLDLGLAPQATTPPFAQVPAPGQVGVDALARRLIVTSAAGQDLLVAALDDDGVPHGPLTATPTPGAGTFSFDVTPYGTILVAEAATSSVSAFDPAAVDAPLTLTTGAVGTGQAATCWIVVHRSGFAYVANTGSGTLSRYRYTRTGHIALDAAIAANVSGAPTDLTLAGRGDFLYALDAARGAIAGFSVDPRSGSLRPVETQGGLPAAAGIQGIAARDF